MNRNFGISATVSIGGLLMLSRDPQAYQIALELMLAGLSLFLLVIGFKKQKRLALWMASLIGVLALAIESVLQHYWLSNLALRFGFPSLFAWFLPTPLFWAMGGEYLLVAGLLLLIFLGLVKRKGVAIHPPGKHIGALVLMLFLVTVNPQLSAFTFLGITINAINLAIVLASLVAILLILPAEGFPSEALLLTAVFVPLWLDSLMFLGLRPIDLATFSGVKRHLYLALLSYLPIFIFLIVIPVGALSLGEANRERWVLIASAVAIALIGIVRVVFTFEHPSDSRLGVYAPNVLIRSLYVLWLWLPILFMKFMRKKGSEIAQPTPSQTRGPLGSTELPGTTPS